MAIDLSRILNEKVPVLTEPRDIFASLPEKPWSRLRPEQSEVLKVWFERKEETDLVIKLNTGGGKTLAGLLIAQSSINEGKYPAAYLTPDKFLAQQTIDEARKVGLCVIEDPRDECFRSGEAILVTTFQKLINGRSVFGLRGGTNPIPIKTIIIDDAHAALSAVQSQFSVQLPHDSGGYRELLELFAEDLRRQSAKSYEDILSGTYGTPLRVSPRLTLEKTDRVFSILMSYKDDNTISGLFFSFPFVADSLKFSIITFTNKSVEVKTPCPNIDLIPSFSQANRRVYLSATLSEESVLVTELDANPESIAHLITPERASDLGDRLIIAPSSINPSLNKQQLQEMIKTIAEGEGDCGTNEVINVVVLVPDSKTASSWTPFTDKIYYADTMSSTIKKLVEGESVGLVVLVNKYDGVNLPHNACRLLVVDGVPLFTGVSGQREMAALFGSPAFDSRKVQRIEQGMGRGIRDAEDYCAVLLLSSDAALTLRDQQQRKYYSQATQAQIELSKQAIKLIEGGGISEIKELIETFLGRDEKWKTFSKNALASIGYNQTGVITEIAKARRIAFDKAIIGEIDQAIDELRKGIDSLDNDLEKGWYLEELAGYMQLLDQNETQKILAAARQKNPAVLKPELPFRGKPKTVYAKQGEASAAFLSKQYSAGTDFQLGIRRIFENISWGDTETTSLAEEQIMLLGKHLGFESSQPEKEVGDGGPDGLWRICINTNAVIELKTGVSRESPVIIKSEAEQLGHSITWDKQVNDGVEKHLPVMLHPSNTLDEKAHLPKDSRVITPSDLLSLQADIEKFSAELSFASTWSDQNAVTEALRRNDLFGTDVIMKHSSAPKRV